ncbi:MAG: META domain-containing protein [Mycobacteriaceae bacterium]
MRTTLVLGTALALTAAGCAAAAASDPLTGTSWQLLGIDSMAPGEQPGTTIPDPSRYTVSFGDDGRAVLTVDCNRGNSAWQAEVSGTDSGSLTFGPIALTRMFCPQPSADTEVAAALGRVRSFLISDGKLHLSLEADSGVMRWQPTP